jgi:outer membrane protein OmpA-like peptidoglycan-associated protein
MMDRTKIQGEWQAFKPALTAVCFMTLLLLVTGGCATSDPSAVNAARTQVNAARETGLTAADSLDFKEAERHLSEAEKMLEDNEDQALIDHEAEMASVYSMVAVSRTEATAAQKEASGVLTGARANTAVTRVAVEVAIRNARSVNAQQTERGLVLTLGGVLFAFNSAELTQEARLSVARVAGFLIALPDRDAIVEGHADNIGGADYNIELSKRRAESIRAALIESGVEEGRLVAEGYGSNFPVASNDTDAGREQNRRVEIVILNAGLRAQDARR